MPVDTSHVELPEELDRLAEMIAKNVHEVWAEGRMKDGWTYGSQRNDTERKHPCLVPYEELSEEETVPHTSSKHQAHEILWTRTNTRRRLRL